MQQEAAAHLRRGQFDRCRTSKELFCSPALLPWLQRKTESDWPVLSRTCGQQEEDATCGNLNMRIMLEEGNDIMVWTQWTQCAALQGRRSVQSPACLSTAPPTPSRPRRLLRLTLNFNNTHRLSRSSYDTDIIDKTANPAPPLPHPTALALLLSLGSPSCTSAMRSGD